MRIRLPCVAGHFYEREKRPLLEQVKECLPQSPTRRSVKAALVPHAGLMYSGKVAGEIYATLEWTRTVVFLGPNHTGEGRPISVSKAERWRTPLGDVEVDQKLVSLLRHHLPELEEDDGAHQFEHSLEVQLPFLQLLSEKTRIVPVCVGFATLETYKKLGTDLAEAASSFPEKVVVIATSDMTHYEPHAHAKEKDQYALQAVLAVDPDELARRVKERKISMCGVAPTVAMLSYARRMGATRGELLRYQTSGDASGEYASVVGYAGVLIP